MGIRDEILGDVNAARLKHTIGCERAAIDLAMRYGADVNKASLAAVAHDITKCLDYNSQMDLCREYNIIISDVERRSPQVLHQTTAAKVSQYKYGLDIEICNAIACHTTGKADMHLLDKIIYIADFIEETREFIGVEDARALSNVDLDKTLLYCLNFSITELIRGNRLIHQLTLDARNYLIFNNF